ncbi:MAG: heme o synthase [Gemmatimonadaceae bacterium]
MPTTVAASPADFLALTKPRIVAMVAVTAAAGYALGVRALPAGQYPATSLAAQCWVLLHATLGTALVAGGTSALNQVVERDVDALMRRTARRPLPAGRVTVRAASVFAWAISALGVAELLAFVNARTAILAAATLVVYVYAYTPLKRRSHLATLVGAVPGALPVVGGWSAAGAPIDARPAALFAILLLWQLPHFLALSWMYREDYTRAGLRMLSVDDVDGTATFRQAALNAAALLPISLAPTALAMAGRVYFFVALALSGVLLALALSGARAPTPARARRLFVATLAYLPALLGTLIAAPAP